MGGHSNDWNNQRGAEWRNGARSDLALESGAAAQDSDGEGPIGGGARGRASSFFGVRSASPGVESSYGEMVGGQDEREGYDDADGDAAQVHHHQQQHQRGPSRSSFYGLEAPTHRGAGAEGGTSSPGDYSRAQTPSSSQHASMRHLPQGGDSGSGSHSSHDAPRQQQPRYHSAPYAASRAGSLYGISSTPSGLGHDSTGPPAPLLDQSHLRPGALASLLTHEKTLDLYRANAKKTNDPDVQFEFCTFVMEVVGEMEAAQELEAATIGGPRGVTEQELAAKHKQQALISESVGLLNKLATRGHVKSQYFLADCYTQGVGTAKVSVSHSACERPRRRS